MTQVQKKPPVRKKCPSIGACSWTSLLPLTLDSHPGSFFDLSHSLSTATCASGIFIAWGKRMGLCTRLQWVMEFYPLSAICSWWPLSSLSWLRDLCDSWASIFMLRNRLVNFVVAGFEVMFPEHACDLHVTADSICDSKFLRASFIFEFQMFQSNMTNSSQSSRLSFAQCCFSFCLKIFDLLVHTSGHVCSGLDVACIFVLLSQRPHFSWGGAWFSIVKWVNSVNGHDSFWSPSTFLSSSTFV